MLSDLLIKQGWTAFIDLRVFTFEDLRLPIDSSDRVVWQTVQKRQLLLLTANRRMIGEDSLEQVLREENSKTSLPVVTVADPDQFLQSAAYRQCCLNRLIDIVLDVDNLLGTGRLFIPY